MAVYLVFVTLAVVGFFCAFFLWRRRDDVPVASWTADPTTDDPVRRFWDGQAWTSSVTEGTQTGNRGKRFEGRFWGWWLLLVPVAFVIQIIGSVIYSSTQSAALLALFSALTTTVVCLTFYVFVSRQLQFGQVVTWWQIVACTVGGAGASIAVAGAINDAILNRYGLQVAVITVGVVEELTKLLIPFILYLCLRYRNPRAGIAMGLASAAGFAVAEAADYAFSFPEGGAPNPCTANSLTPAPGVAATTGEQLLRVFTVEPLHFLWTGIAVAVIWRLWRVYGTTRFTPAVIGALLIPVVLHSANDSSTYLACGGTGGQSVRVALVLAIPLVSYLLFKFFASQSTAPDIVASVSKGWHPARLKSQPYRTEDGEKETTLSP